MEKVEDLICESFPLFPIFLGKAALVAQLVEHPLEQVQISGIKYAAVAMPWHCRPQCGVRVKAGGPAVVDVGGGRQA
ncbi:hypothetical protein [Mesorhizobium sp. M4A.F.Ca.ET.022.05.2.1]|uniref:hypothetical protein n=1 Tax=Mesorhizobium sp. M4A.F.Ca.ET.022.05.2.1 TaxID=2496653 RepID=UPI001676815D|nr:hypothetical protein [Mesorhizobium sp. M4A.F.Ca.ET.022.05.2.1]